MARDWIKVRTSLSTDPKVLRIASIISKTTYVGKSLQQVSDERVIRDVTRDVTVASLVTLWSVTNEHTRDGVWNNVTPNELDDVVGLVGFCDALIQVGWLIHDEDNDKCILPNFLEYNSPVGSTSRSKGAERQKAYRERKKLEAQKSDDQRNDSDAKSNDNGDVTRDVTLSPRDRVRDRVREEKINNKNTMSGTPDDAPQADRVASNPKSMVPAPKPAKPKRKTKGSYSQESRDVLDYMNTKFGSRYEHTDANLKLIDKVLSVEGRTPDLAKQVIDDRWSAWASDTKMSTYLRPKTIFAEDNFSQYVGRLGVKSAADTAIDEFCFGKPVNSTDAAINAFCNGSETVIDGVFSHAN